MSQLSPEQIAAMRAAMIAVLDTVEEAGSLGAPSGIMYLAFSAMGMSLHNYESMLGALQRLNLVTVDADCVHRTATPRPASLTAQPDHA